MTVREGRTKDGGEHEENPLGNFANIDVDAFLRDSEKRVADFAKA
ncbi:hypothetical protein [Nonomuraea sp. NPDC049400]